MEASKACPMAVALSCIACIWSCSPPMVDCMVSIIVFMARMFSIMGGITVSICGIRVSI